MKRMLRLARLGVGGADGGGRQFMSWITLADEVGAILHLLDRPEITGPVNLVSREPARQRDIVAALGRGDAPPAVLPGARRSACTSSSASSPGRSSGSQRIAGDVLVRAGYQHQHPDVQSAVRWLVG